MIGQADTSKSIARDSLTEIQLKSFERFEQRGIKELLGQVFPIQDESKISRFTMDYGDEGDSPGFELEEPKNSEAECREQGLTYASSLYVRLQLVIREKGAGEERVAQRIFFGEIPRMTKHGTFIINGAERVVVSQVVRAPGVYFGYDEDPYTKEVFSKFKIIPHHGAWVEVETASTKAIYIKIDRKRKMPITTFLQALGMSRDAIKRAFKDVPGALGPARGEQREGYIEATLARDTAKSRIEALTEMYKRLRPSEPVITDEEKAVKFVESNFYDEKKFDLSPIGRYKLDKKLNRKPSKKRYVALSHSVLTREDFVDLVKHMVRRMKKIADTPGIESSDYKLPEDDVDHLGNRRVRTVEELLKNQLLIGLMRMGRSVVERMSTTQLDAEKKTHLSPAAFVNNRPIVSAVHNFFASSQLSQFMDQTNPLAEMTHKRRISAMGSGGLTRERASFDVRDVHYSHYGRLCPIETPEGPNIGLLNSLATFAKVDEFGLIQAPYYRVFHKMRSDSKDLVGRTLTKNIEDDGGKVLAEAGATVDEGLFKRLAQGKVRNVEVRPYVIHDDIKGLEYLSADDEFKPSIAHGGLVNFTPTKAIQASSPINHKREIMVDKVQVRQGETFFTDDISNVDLLDYSAIQTVSVTTALIPFLEHDDANRALMGSNMQRQAVPLIKSKAPIIGTGMERVVAQDSDQVVFAEVDGVISYVSSDRIVITDAKGVEHERLLVKFVRSNQGTCINQRPNVKLGQLVEAASVIADSYSSDHGELALGQNLLVGFMSWRGYNFEDAIIVSEDLVQQDMFTSVHIEKHELEMRETKLGPEEMTRDIPGVSESSLRNLDDEGVVRIGSWVEPGDILVGKISPRGETELTAEEKLLRAIFGDKAHDVQDSSKRLPHGQRGKVFGAKVYSRITGDKMPVGVLKVAHIWVARARKLVDGDKMAGRHGNKGVVAKVLPREDMPYLEDGRRLDIILNPIGVPSRMNLGQLMESYLGWSANKFNFEARMPVFQSLSQSAINAYMAQSWLVARAGAGDRAGLDGADIDYGKLDEWLEERGLKRDALWGDSEAAQKRVVNTCMRIWLDEVLGEEESARHKDADLLKLGRTLEHERAIPCPISGKQTLYDGITGEPFMQPVSVGYVYMMKLSHLADDKMHARSTGPYSLITQQPLGGKAQFGGQRLGEMEVWALQAYSAAHTLQELLTIKSDDVQGRNEAYEAICRGDQVSHEGTPESFQVLIKEMQSLGLQVEQLSSGQLGGAVDDAARANIEIDEEFDADIEIDESLLTPDMGSDSNAGGEGAEGGGSW